MPHKIEQLKWLYGGLAGFCAAFFLAILGTNQPINASIPLLLSAICFGILLPLFTAFTLVHITFIELQTPSEIVEAGLSKKWVCNLTWFAQILLYIAITLLVFHTSVIVGSIFCLSTVCVLIAYIVFFRSLKK